MNDKKIRVLLLEDRETDAALILRELRRVGFEPDWQRIDTEAEFAASLGEPSIDVILADYRLPRFDALAALRCVQVRQLDIPFIVVSGALGDEFAVQCIKQGVTDYLLKDRLERLGLAVSKAIEERRNRMEKRHLEEQLRQAHKMETLGQLAGGIAHDFSNLLTVINGRAWLLLEHDSHPPETTAALQEIQRAGERAASLARQLLFFSRKRPLARRTLELNATIHEVAAILRRLIGEHIRIDLKLDAHLPPIEADESLIEQLLINLAVNSRDAMPRGGRLLIKSRATARTAEDARGNSPRARPGNFACITVADTGCGIEPQHLPRIFEPFFTTKEPGKGTGIGLASVASIVQQHEGWVEIQTAVGVGTSFHIYLPLAVPSVVPQPEVEQPGTKVKGGRERILVVEDDAGVRDLTVSALRLYGYDVLQARSAVEARALWQQQPTKPDLLLTDLVLPDDMSGTELAAALQAESRALTIIFTSGYTPDMARLAPDYDEEVQFIHKPFQPCALAQIVRKALDAKRAAHEARECVGAAGESAA